MMIPIGYYQVNPSYFSTQVADHQTIVSLPQSSSSKQTESKTKSQTKLYIQFRPKGSDVRAEIEQVRCLIYLGDPEKLNPKMWVLDLKTACWCYFTFK